jgi:hypothetical protein
MTGRCNVTTYIYDRAAGRVIEKPPRESHVVELLPAADGGHTYDFIEDVTRVLAELFGPGGRYRIAGPIHRDRLDGPALYEAMFGSDEP